MKHSLLGVAGILLSVLTAGAGAMGDEVVQVPSGTPIAVELKTYLNTKKAKVGDAVKLEVTRDVLGKDKEKLIPHGAKLFGKVTRVVPQSKDAEAAISILAERAEWKGGSATLHAVIAGSVRPPEINSELMASANSRGGSPGVNGGKDSGSGAGLQDSVGSAVEESMSAQNGQPQASKPDEFRHFQGVLTSGVQGSHIEGVGLRLSPDHAAVTELFSKKNVELEQGVTMVMRNFLPDAEPAKQTQK